MGHRCRFSHALGRAGAELEVPAGLERTAGHQRQTPGASRVIMIIFSWRHCARRHRCGIAAVSGGYHATLRRLPWRASRRRGLRRSGGQRGPEGGHPSGGGPEAVVSRAPEAAGDCAAGLWRGSAGIGGGRPSGGHPGGGRPSGGHPGGGRPSGGHPGGGRPSGGCGSGGCAGCGCPRRGGSVGWGWKSWLVLALPRWGPVALTDGRAGRFCCFVGGGVRIGRGKSHQSHKTILRYLFYRVLLS
jgi:hypothetical protein